MGTFRPKYNYRGIGRPTSYSEEVLQKAYDYLDECDREFQIPYIQELALVLGVNQDTLYEWAKAKNEDNNLRYPEFSEALKMIKSCQELKLLRSSMYAFSSTGSLFQLKTNHGYVETEKRVIEAKVQNEDMKTLADLANAKVEQMRGQTTSDK